MLVTAGSQVALETLLAANRVFEHREQSKRRANKFRGRGCPGDQIF
jgi:hypothetical protein